MNYGQAEAVSTRFSRKERIENPGLVLEADSTACIRDLHHETLTRTMWRKMQSGCCPRGADNNRPTFLSYGLRCVGHEVHDNPLQLSRIRLDSRQRSIEFDFQHYVLRHNDHQQVPQILYNLRQINWLRNGTLLPAINHELPYNATAANCDRANLVQPFGGQASRGQFVQREVSLSYYAA